MANKFKQVFMNRSAAVTFLVAEGKPLNFAKAAVNETYNYEQDQDPRDLMWGWPECGEDTGDGDAVPVVVMSDKLLIAYNTMEQMFSVENEQILLDGEATYDIKGNHLQY